MRKKFFFFKKWGKRGVNDISIASGIFAVFILTAVLIPFINADFDTSFSEFDTDELKRDATEDTRKVTGFNAFTIMINVFRLAFWDFGDTLQLPFWLDAIFTLFTIILVFILARNIWVGGGG